LYAVIETESAFDPMATSWVPAYGLMQIVPESAGMDVTEELFGEARILSPSYLYIPENNILIGSTYLNLLKTRYLSGIKNRQSRLYCSVAAYNTGPHNVAKAFTGKRQIDDAIRDINGMTPEQVYNTLSADLPYDETKKYLEKVIRRIDKYNEYGV
jgi:membrane-bound lytic murein transglycosylase C